MLNNAEGGQVDGHLRTSHPDVYAIGDVAAFPLKRYGNVTRQVGARVVGAPSWL
jgi:monodehydroascorbate reductase (NADH)